MTSPPSLADRFRSSSISNSISQASTSGSASASPSRSATPTRQPQQRALSKPYRPKYHSRSLSSNPQSTSKPIVLPFPDLPVRPISRDGSRAGSPTGPRTPMSSPGWTPRGSSTNLVEVARQSSSLLSPPSQASGSGSGSSAGGVAMTSGRSMDGSSSSREGRSSIWNRPSTHSQSTSPTFASPLASSSTPHLGLSASTFRPRALTSPAVDIPRSASSPTSSVSPPSTSVSPNALAPTSYTSPNQSPASPPQFASGSGSRSASALPSRLASFPSTSQTQLSRSVPPPTPEKDRPRPISKPPKQGSVGSAAVTRPPSGYVPITPAQPSQPLQEHLYRSFLSGECADVRLWVRDWGVAWLVHKMVLVQAGFFHSLFLGGFSETGMTAKRSSRKGKERDTGLGDDDWSGEDVELRFDDPNITQEAFEICLSRLYSPHPRLLFPVALLPSPSHPLTPVFPSFISPSDGPASQNTPTALTAHSSPELLLSLLATTIYLGHAPLMREVTAIILRTVGPGTIGRYLAFALGEGCGSDDMTHPRDFESVAKPLPRSMCQEDVDEDEGDVSELLPGEDESEQYNHASTHRDSTTSTDSKLDEDVKVGSIPLTSSMPAHISGTAGSSIPATAGPVHRTISNASTIRAPSARLGMSQRQPDPSIYTSTGAVNASSASLDMAAMPHFYGFASDKIGEACACWLSRWSMDVLSAEIALANLDNGDSEEGYRIFRHRGIPASFLRGLLSSDSLWVKGEMERYEATREILEMRRKGWETEWEAAHGEEEDGAEGEEEEGWEEWDEDEEQLAKVFAEGIYYSHMSFENLSIIASDIDPTTNLPYAPLSVLQAAHWTAADLKSRIIAHDPSAAESDEAELGLTITPAELAEAAKRSMRRVTPRGRLVSPGSGTLGKSTTTPNHPSPSSGNLSLSLSGRNTSNISIASAALTSGETIYHPIPVDNTHQSGAGGLLFLATQTTASAPIAGMSGMPDLGPSLAGKTGFEDDGHGIKKNTQPAGENSWFGLKNGSRTSSEIISSLTPSPVSPSFFYPHASPAGDSRWTPTQPFRFSVEFWDVDTLPEKERLYSTTHFHAGSWWNVYVQTIRKKEKNTTQLGVYLHRQSLKEGVPRASRPSGDSGRGGDTGMEDVDARPDVLEARGTRVEVRRERRSEGDAGHNFPRGSPAAIMMDLHGRTPPAVSTSMASGGGVGSGTEDIEADTVGEETYKDARRVTRAYFSITCASALGTALVRFSSAPDSFTLSQSWGWKSSALRSEEYLAVAPVPVPAADEDGALGWVGEISDLQGGSRGRGSLRATVVVGVI